MSDGDRTIRVCLPDGRFGCFFRPVIANPIAARYDQTIPRHQLRFTAAVLNDLC